MLGISYELVLEWVLDDIVRGSSIVSHHWTLPPIFPWFLVGTLLAFGFTTAVQGAQITKRFILARLCIGSDLSALSAFTVTPSDHAGPHCVSGFLARDAH